MTRTAWPGLAGRGNRILLAIGVGLVLLFVTDRLDVHPVASVVVAIVGGLVAHRAATSAVRRR